MFLPEHLYNKGREQPARKKKTSHTKRLLLAISILVNADTAEQARGPKTLVLQPLNDSFLFQENNELLS